MTCEACDRVLDEDTANYVDPPGAYFCAPGFGCCQEPPGLRAEWEREVGQYRGMPENPNGHRYGCGCDDCCDHYRSLRR